jgi:hypothetical protein
MNIGRPFHRLFLFFLFLPLLTLSLCAVIIRHDKADSLYLELGRNHRKHIIHFNLPDGEGTLIAPQWILTAAHVASDAVKGTRVSIAGRYFTVQSRFLHPGWREEARFDIALVRLSRPVRGIEPIPLYRGTEEEGQIATILGCGLTGNGKIGQNTAGDGQLRAARNRIEKATPFWIKLLFDPPEDALDLEGVSGQGDSGGPALIKDNGSLFVAGVSALQTFSKPGLFEGKYGVTDYYLRVSSFVPWIEGVIQENSGR